MSNGYTNTTNTVYKPPNPYTRASGSISGQGQIQAPSNYTDQPTGPGGVRSTVPGQSQTNIEASRRSCLNAGYTGYDAINNRCTGQPTQPTQPPIPAPTRPVSPGGPIDPMPQPYQPPIPAPPSYTDQPLGPGGIYTPPGPGVQDCDEALRATANQWCQSRNRGVAVCGANGQWDCSLSEATPDPDPTANCGRYGAVLNSTTGKCECPYGTTWNNAQQLCVKGQGEGELKSSPSAREECEHRQGTWIQTSGLDPNAGYCQESPYPGDNVMTDYQLWRAAEQDRWNQPGVAGQMQTPGTPGGHNIPSPTMGGEYQDLLRQVGGSETSGLPQDIYANLQRLGGAAPEMGQGYLDVLQRGTQTPTPQGQSAEIARLQQLMQSGVPIEQLQPYLEQLQTLSGYRPDVQGAIGGAQGLTEQLARTQQQMPGAVGGAQGILGQLAGRTEAPTSQAQQQAMQGLLGLGGAQAGMGQDYQTAMQGMGNLAGRTDVALPPEQQEAMGMLRTFAAQQGTEIPASIQPFQQALQQVATSQPYTAEFEKALVDAKNEQIRLTYEEPMRQLEQSIMDRGQKQGMHFSGSMEDSLLREKAKLYEKMIAEQNVAAAEVYNQRYGNVLQGLQTQISGSQAGIQGALGSAQALTGRLGTVGGMAEAMGGLGMQGTQLQQAQEAQAGQMAGMLGQQAATPAELAMQQQQLQQGAFGQLGQLGGQTVGQQQRQEQLAGGMAGMGGELGLGQFGAMGDELSRQQAAAGQLGQLGLSGTELEQQGFRDAGALTQAGAEQVMNSLNLRMQNEAQQAQAAVQSGQMNQQDYQNFLQSQQQDMQAAEAWSAATFGLSTEERANRELQIGANLRRGELGIEERGLQLQQQEMFRQTAQTWGQLDLGAKEMNLNGALQDKTLEYENALKRGELDIGRFSAEVAQNMGISEQELAARSGDLQMASLLADYSLSKITNESEWKEAMAGIEKTMWDMNYSERNMFFGMISQLIGDLGGELIGG